LKRACCPKQTWLEKLLGHAFSCRAALTWSYGMNCAVVAIAIFHAGVFPLYKSTSTTRYKHKMQVCVACMLDYTYNPLVCWFKCAEYQCKPPPCMVTISPWSLKSAVFWQTCAMSYCRQKCISDPFLTFYGINSCSPCFVLHMYVCVFTFLHLNSNLSWLNMSWNGFPFKKCTGGLFSKIVLVLYSALLFDPE